MRLICPKCDAQYEVDAQAIPEHGRDVQCSNCGHGWFVLREKAPPAPELAPPVAAPVAAPHVMIDPEDEWEPKWDSDWPPLPQEVVPHPEPSPETAQPTVHGPWAESIRAMAPSQETEFEEDEPATVTDLPPPRRVLDESVLAVLREEAARELAARQAEAEAYALASGAPVASAPVVNAPVVSPTVMGPTVAAANVAAPVTSEPVAPEPADVEPSPSNLESPEPALPEPALAEPALPEPVAEMPQEAQSVPELPVSDTRPKVQSAPLPETAPLAEIIAGLAEREEAPMLDLQREELELAERTQAPSANDPAQRRDALPNVDEINSSLRPSENAGELFLENGTVLARRGFGLGFGLMIVLAVVAVLLYLYAPELALQAPWASKEITGYMQFVDGLRGSLDQIIRNATRFLNGGF